MKYKKKYPLIMKKENSSVASLEKIISFCEKLKSFRFFISIEPKTSYHKNYKFCYYCFYVYSQPIAQIFFYLCIFIPANMLEFYIILYQYIFYFFYRKRKNIDFLGARFIVRQKFIQISAFCDQI